MTRTATRTAPLRAVPDQPGAPTRAAQLETFAMVLRTAVNRRGKPYSPDTIAAYCTAVGALNRWLTKIGYPHGFDALAVQDLNGFLAAYRADHGQGGTVTKQQNLRVFLRFVSEEFDTDDLWLRNSQDLWIGVSRDLLITAF